MDLDVATAAPSTARLNAMAKARNAARTFIGSRLASRSAPSRRNNCRHLDFKTEEKAPFPRIIQIESTSTYGCNVVTRRCRALLFVGAIRADERLCLVGRELRSW